MLSVQELDLFCQSAIQSVDGLKDHFLVISESHLRKKLRGVKPEQSPFLLTILPSARSQAASKDAILWSNELMFFILKGPINYSNRNQDQEVNDYGQTQLVADDFLNYIDEASRDCHWLQRYDGDAVELDPEYNFQSCDGWSLTFNLKTS